MWPTRCPRAPTHLHAKSPSNAERQDFIIQPKRCGYFCACLTQISFYWVANNGTQKHGKRHGKSGSKTECESWCFVYRWIKWLEAKVLDGRTCNRVGWEAGSNTGLRFNRDGDADIWCRFFHTLAGTPLYSILVILIYHTFISTSKRKTVNIIPDCTGVSILEYIISNDFVA